MHWCHHRENPLIDTRWFATGSFARFAISILFIRMLLSEQTVGAPGLLQALNMAPEQIQGLYVIMFLATVAGALAATVAFARWPKAGDILACATLAMIALGAWMDSQATSQTHPANLYASQAMIAFAASIFMAVVIMQGLGHLMRRGLSSLITFVITFGVTQSLGGVLGSALLGSFQVVRVAHHLSYLSDSLTLTNPQAALLLQTYTGAYASTVADPAARSAQGLSTVSQQVLQQANVLAFNDVFLLILGLALAQIALIIAFTLWSRLAAPRLVRRAAAPPAPAPTVPAESLA